MYRMRIKKVGEYRPPVDLINVFSEHAATISEKHISFDNKKADMICKEIGVLDLSYHI
jgi:hypothetical protein